MNYTSNLKERTGGLNSVVDSDKDDQVKNNKDLVGGSKEGTEGNNVGERNPSEEKDLNLKGDGKKGEGGSVGKGENKDLDLKGDGKKSEDGSVGKGENKGLELKGDGKKGEDGSMGNGENKEGDKVVKKGGNNEGLSGGGKGDNKDELSGGLESKKAVKEEPVVLPPVRKEGSHGEECDASNSCKSEKDALIACLRVPGNGTSCFYCHIFIDC